MLRSAVREPVDATVAEAAKQKAELEREILKEGKATCSQCREEIWNNPAMANAGYTWESESMLGWCEKSRDHKHHPKIELKKEENDA